MARPGINREKAAMILADAEIKGDRETALSWNVHVKTIENYRARLLDDPELVEFFQKFRKLKQQSWVNEVPTVIATVMDYMKRGFNAVNYDAETLLAANSVLSTLADIELTRMLIDKRFEQEAEDDDADEG